MPCVLVLCLTLGAAAQNLPDYETWEGVADRAERVIDGGRVSDPTLEALRLQLVDWRARFQEAQGLNADRIESLMAQIAALGPAPEEGPDTMAEQRGALNARLTEAEAPVRRARAEFERVQGLIGEIDSTLAERRTGELLSLGPSPLNPAHWPEAISAVAGWIDDLGAEIVRLTGAESHRAAFRANVPVILLYLIAALLFLGRGWRWVDHLMQPAIAREEASPAARLVLFFLSLLQAAMPVFGVAAAQVAIQATGFTGLRASVVVGTWVDMAIIVMVSVWLGRQIFPVRETAVHPLNLTPGQRLQGRWTATVIGVVVAFNTLLDAVSGIEAFSDAARLILRFPIIVALGVLLLRLGRLLTQHVARQGERTDEISVYNQVIRVLGWLIILTGLAGPVLAAVGYHTAGITFLLPAIKTLALFAFLRVLQRLVANLYGALTGKREGLDDALTPALIGFLLAFISLPILALIWGVRPAQLADMWHRVIEGVSVGGVTISLQNFLIFAIVFVVGMTTTRLLQAALRSSVLPKTRLDSGGRNAILAGTGYVGIFLAAVIAITSAGIDLGNLAIVAGALSVGIGFGLQTIVSNFVSGVILLIERPIKEGDWIEVNGTMGYVRSISVRSTRIETFDRSDVIVPNADLISGVVTNMTHHNNTGRVIVGVGVAYGTDTRKVEGILREVAEAHPMVLLNPPPSVVFMGFGADSLDFEIRAILRDVNWMLSVKSEMNHEIARRFAEEGIEIPFAQRDIWLRNPEALRNCAADKPGIADG
ncbi:MAG: DUF3772 domain-containing protein [Rhodobacteraceae bacterium]|nr:DUF3772 domain-containing protein [Paracoccaceae bacterium]